MHFTKEITILERLSLISIYARLPFKLLLTVLLSPFLKQYKKKRTNRVVIESSLRFIFGHASVRQLQWTSGTSLDIYRTWAKGRGVQPDVEELSGNAKLVWLTKKKTDRVLIYVHGGAYMLPAIPHMFSFGPGIHQELLQRDGAKDFGVVALLYSLHPAQFPTQLNELTSALVHLFSSGLKQENAILIGDSCGGNLIVQLLVHTLHPFEGVPPSPLQPLADAVDVAPRQHLGGVCLLSPWFSIDTPTPSYTRNSEFDMLPGSAFLYLGRKYMEGVPESHIPWIKPTSLPPDSEERWFAGLDKYVGRVLITAGSREVLLDDSIGLYSALTKLPARNIDVQLDVEEDGIHEDPVFDVSFPQKPGGGLSDATMKIVNWVGESFGF